MSTLMIPCAGKKYIDGHPVYLKRHPSGKRLIEYSIQGVFNSKYEKVLVVLLAEDEEKYQAKTIIENELSDYPIEVLLLDGMTSGPAETVYQAIKKASLTGSVVVKDADNYLKTEKSVQGNFVVGLDLNTWERDIHNLRNKSFLIVNEQENLLDIIEKRVRSDVISIGLYGFKKAEDFITAYEHLSDVSYPIAKLYVSHVISYLIGYSGRVFRYIACSEYENWGDDRLWKDMQRDYTLYFIDLDHILGDSGKLSAGNRDKLRKLQERGASFIGFTVHDEAYKTAALQILQESGISFIKLVYGCPYSEQKEIIVSEDMLNRKIIEL